MFSKSQQKLISYFATAVKSDTLRQTYIIKGEEGIGKKTAVKKISEYIMCHDSKACGICNGCKSLSVGANPDCVRISNGDKKTIELSKIRDMIKEVYIKPIGSKYKLFIIENAHLMESSPQNALLKVIEEPPSYAVFVLICDNLNAILPTILSRAMVLEAEAVGIDELKAICPLSADNEYMYTYCLGNIGTLKSISTDDDFQKLRNDIIGGFVKMISADEYGIYEVVDLWTKNKDFKNDMINILVMFLRDVMFFKNSMTDNIANTDKIKEIQALSHKLTYKHTFEILTLVNDMPRLAGKYGNFSMIAQTVMMKIKNLCISKA